MPPVPQTITLRKKLAQQIRNRLGDYRRDANDVTDMGRVLNTISDATALAMLEGIHVNDIHAAVNRGLSGNLATNS